MAYRYRAYPTNDQIQQFERTFGCARVVYNDVIQVREAAYAAGKLLSDTEVQSRVITTAKLTPEREWLTRVASVALVQACRDANRAYRNFFASQSGRRKGQKVRHPRFKSRKNNRQSIRLTRNGFGVTDKGVRIAKVGNVKLKWSRSLPSIPSSVTIVKEPDGRYYASFVVEVAQTPLPTTTNDIGVDLGLETLIATSNGELIANPRHFRSRQRKLARAQKVMSRKQIGSSNRTKARIKVAVQHRKVRETRADNLHKTALRLIRDNQTVYVENLAISGLGRTKLAKSVHDAGWAKLVRLLEEKAVRYERKVVKIDRFFPSSQLCSSCGHRDGAKPLNIRKWPCGECGTIHHRDVNAAINILVEGRKVAARLAETQNACGADVRPELVPATGDEAGTHRGVA